MLAIGCDHGGYELKKEILAWLDSKNIEYRDFGCHSTEAVNYPVYAKAVAEAVVSGENKDYLNEINNLRKSI